jgi:DNA invertase Pin-like site-specific DNA recombinase
MSKNGTQKFVAYYRVSTARQGRSGLGLDAQRESVERHVRASGGRLIGEFKEVESGKRADRPELAKALAACRVHGAVLIVAKLDRLSRNVAFLSTLMESGCDFLCADNPHATRFTIHILAAVAEHEREMISKRTREALGRSRKALGGKRWNISPSVQRRASLAGCAEIRSAAAARARDLLPEIEAARSAGAASLAAIARALNARSVPTPSGAGVWHASTISRVETYASAA